MTFTRVGLFHARQDVVAVLSAVLVFLSPDLAMFSLTYLSKGQRYGTFMS